MLKQLTYFGHSCFRIEAMNGWIGVTDPYRDSSVPGLKLPVLEADDVFCSHEHADHNGKENVKLRSPGIENPYSVKTVLTDHDDKGGSLRGKNNVLILSAGDEKIVHLGDIGCIPSAEVLEPMKHADILMIPCGGFYTIGAEEAKNLIDLLEPKLAVLMHFRSGSQGYDVLASKKEICHEIPGTITVEDCSVRIGQYEGIVILEPHPDAVQNG